MIRFEGVRVRYGAVEAVRGVDFEAPAGRLTALVGPNGSGKSSCVRALLARDAAAGGDVWLGTTRVASLAERARARCVAVVPQRETPAFPMPVREFVALGRFPWDDAAPVTGRHVDAALDRAGALSVADRSTDAVSGGEWQRVRMARALAQDTPAIVLDEPTAFLDIAHEMAAFELLRALADEGRAVLVVTHQLNLVARFADTVVLLHDGRVAASGTPDVVMTGPTLERVYGWPIVVSRDPAVGAPMLIPLRSSRTPTSG